MIFPRACPTKLWSGLLTTLTLLILVPESALAQITSGWNPLGDSPQARVKSKSFAIDGRLVVFGGFAYGFTASSRVDAYDPKAGSWSSLANLPIPVTHEGATVDNRSVWMAGGFVGDNPGPVTDAVWRYDIDLNLWFPGPSLPAPRASGGLFVLGRGLHFVGGVEIDRDTDSAVHWVLDLDHVNQGWQSAQPMPIAHNHFSTIVVNNVAYIIGGQRHHDNSPSDVDNMFSFDNAHGWSTLPSLPFPRSHFESSTFEYNGRIVIAGGRSKALGLEALDEVTSFDPNAAVWACMKPLPMPLVAPSVAFIDDQFILNGGAADPAFPMASTFRCSTAPPGPKTLRINSGGPALTLPMDWHADYGFQGGISMAEPTLVSLNATVDDEVFRYHRTSSNSSPDRFNYAIPLSSGQYKVSLFFAELTRGSNGSGVTFPGQRVFDVRIEGIQVLKNYDIFSSVGLDTADRRDFVLPVSDGVLNIQLKSSVGRPIISGLEIVLLGDFASFCAAPLNSSGKPAQIVVIGTPLLGAGSLDFLGSGIPPSKPCILLQSQESNLKPFSGGYLCVGSPFIRLGSPVYSNSAGVIQYSLSYSDPVSSSAVIYPGCVRFFQLWFRDFPYAASNFSNGLAVSFAP